VQIVNKNGVQTTVHKRVDAVSPVKGRTLPSPSLPTSFNDDNLKFIVESSFEVMLDGANMSDNVRAKAMTTLHPETLTRIEHIFREEIPTGPIRRAMGICAKNRNFAVLNTMAVLVPEMEDTSVNHQDRLLYALSGLQEERDEKTPQIDITNPDDPRTQGIRVFLGLLLTADEEMKTARTNKKFQQYLSFKDREVGKLILENPDRADEIVHLYRAHGRFDRELFETALEANVPSLIEGTL